MAQKERGLFEVYMDDPERADHLVFGRTAENNRRGFMKGAGLAAMGAALGTAIPFGRHMPSGFIPAALAQSDLLAGKDGLTLLNDRPLNAETPPHLLDDDIAPIARHFIRNNGIPPENMDPGSWELVIDGEVEKPVTYSIADLRSKFEVVKAQLQIECGGNGRAAFNPPASGNQWTLGAVACAEWTGVRVADVLAASGVKSSAVYTAHHGADGHLSGDPDKTPLSRGVPIDKAMDRNNLIAFEMNGEPIHPMNGAPLRLVMPGWPGSCSQKWLKRIQVRDQVHDGTKMTGKAYRVLRHPVAAGTEVPKDDFVIINSMPVKSLITFPETGISAPAGQPVEVRGHAWAGDNAVADLAVSIDFGSSWIKADLHAPPNPFAWQSWNTTVTLPIAGYYEVWARATDDEGRRMTKGGSSRSPSLGIRKAISTTQCTELSSLRPDKCDKARRHIWRRAIFRNQGTSDEALATPTGRRRFRDSFAHCDGGRSRRRVLWRYAGGCRARGGRDQLPGLPLPADGDPAGAQPYAM